MKKQPIGAVMRQAVTLTIPVLCGYLFMGAAFGILLQNAGYGWGWALLMPVVIYAGTMQYMAIPFLVGQAGLLTAAITTLLVHFRHFVYGLSFIGRFRPFGWRKYYMMFALTDETYALMCSAKAPEGTSDEKLLFFIALLDQIYWIVGCVLGNVAGQFLTFDTTGIDFAMTALFVVIAVDQWRTCKSKLPALLGGGLAVLCLILFGSQNMLIPTILLMIICLLALRPKLESIVTNQEENT